ncbi:hypothetical protein PIB30_060066 [Stylosanthes scabra]|uniref:GRF-type domain-containing protein n=1 Tax=Stylosanthes scabra TaxID=79078 RepID=A0ABU6SLS7_9FABA|nr:hypothetical protein [Stylosanthes scabra]
MDPNDACQGSSNSMEAMTKRCRCYCGASVTVLAAPTISGTRRYVACGKVPKCDFFEWIDDEEVNSRTKLKEKRVQCFCRDALVLRMSGTILNPNRRFISCPNRRCKFFEWIDEGEKVCSTQQSCGSQRIKCGSQRTDPNLALMEAQERKIERLHVEVGRVCVEMARFQDQVGKIEKNMQDLKQMKNVTNICIVILIVTLLFVKFA